MTYPASCLLSFLARLRVHGFGFEGVLGGWCLRPLAVRCIMHQTASLLARRGGVYKIADTPHCVCAVVRRVAADYEGSCRGIAGCSRIPMRACACGSQTCRAALSTTIILIAVSKICKVLRGSQLVIRWRRNVNTARGIENDSKNTASTTINTVGACPVCLHCKC